MIFLEGFDDPCQKAKMMVGLKLEGVRFFHYMKDSFVYQKAYS